MYALSSADLCYMLDILQEELADSGLHLNLAKTKVLTIELSNVPLLVDVAGEFVEVLSGADAPRYLGQTLPGDLKQRSARELPSRIQSAWWQLHKHRHVLVDRNNKDKTLILANHIVISL